MFYFLSKLIWPFLDPLNLTMLLLAAGVGFAALRWRIMARFALGGAGALVLLFGLLPGGAVLLRGLEQAYAPPAAMPAHVDGIIILGGTFDPRLSAGRAGPGLNDSSERLLEGLRLARLYPGAALVFTGGKGHPGLPHPEAQDARRFVDAYFPDLSARLRLEDRSRNTYENALYSRELLAPRAGQTWLLVTSAFHMERAVAVFDTAGWPGLVPWPVDYRTENHFKYSLQPVDINRGYGFASLALKERVGLLAYRLSGKIAASPSPPPRVE